MLLVVRRRSRSRCDRPEPTVVLAVGAGCEEQRVGARFGTAAQSQGPQPVDRQRASVEAAHLTKKIPVRVEYIDPAVAEIADQDIPAKAAEGQRGPRNAPGRVQRATRGKPLKQMAVGVEDIDKAVALTGDIDIFCRVLLGVGHKQIAVDILDAEWGKAGRDVRIREAAVGCRGCEQAARSGWRPEHVDRPGAEVGGEKKRSVDVDAESETLVDGAV